MKNERFLINLMQVPECIIHLVVSASYIHSLLLKVIVPL
jgi:hypothetical protein